MFPKYKTMEDFLLKAILKSYNEELFKYLLIRDNNIFSKISIIIVYALILILVILLSTKSVLLGVKMFCLIVAFLYITWMMLYVLMIAPDRYIFKDTIEICERVEKIFKMGFSNYNTYLNDKKIPNINNIIYKNKLPDKKMLSFWKYKLSTRKETFQATLPIVALMLLSIVNIPIKGDILNIIQKIVKVNFVQDVDVKYLKWIFQACWYPYIFIVYHVNIDRINNCISKIELLKDIA